MNHKPDRKLSIDPVISASINGEKFSRIRFESLFSVVERSLEDNRIWVSDFRHDEIYVTSDLHDVISAYHHFYREIRDSA